MSSQPTDAELKALWQIHAADIGGILDFTRAVLAKWGQPAVKGDPVAWLSPWRKDQVTTDYDAYGKHGLPLYTAPQPVAREPLTDERIKDLQDDGVFLGTCRQIVRAIEAAHGIKGGQHGTDQTRA